MKNHKLKYSIVISFTWILLLMAAGGCGKEEFTVKGHLSDAVLRVDGKDLTLSDLAFYILDTETTVQKQALTYDPENPVSYWNLHMNGRFLVLMVKEGIIRTAVHDEIFYQMAKRDNLELTEEERSEVKKRAEDYYAGLSTFQKEAVGLNEDSLYLAMEKIGTAEKYVSLYSIEKNCSPEDLAVDGSEYESLLNQHKWKIYSTVWEEVKVGTVTLWENYEARQEMKQ